MLQNAYLLAKIGADTAENEQHFAEILPHSEGGATPILVARLGCAVSARRRIRGIRTREKLPRVRLVGAGCNQWARRILLLFRGTFSCSESRAANLHVLLSAGKLRQDLPCGCGKGRRAAGFAPRCGLPPQEVPGGAFFELALSLSP